LASVLDVPGGCISVPGWRCRRTRRRLPLHKYTGNFGEFPTRRRKISPPRVRIGANCGLGRLVTLPQRLKGVAGDAGDKGVWLRAEGVVGLLRSPMRRRPAQEFDPRFNGYSIGIWRDTDVYGTYHTLEVETRDLRGPRLFDSTGIPLDADNETVGKEKLYLDKNDPNILRNEITTHDHASTRPRTVSRFYRSEHNPTYEEYPCTEDDRWVTIGSELYLAGGEAI
jgi:hypothetical protein